MRGPRFPRDSVSLKLVEEDLLVTAEALWVWVDAKTMRPKAIPAVLIEAFEQLQAPISGS